MDAQSLFMVMVYSVTSSTVCLLLLYKFLGFHQVSQVFPQSRDIHIGVAINLRLSKCKCECGWFVSLWLCDKLATCPGCFLRVTLLDVDPRTANTPWGISRGSGHREWMDVHSNRPT